MIEPRKKMRGGHRFDLAGVPSDDVEALPLPDEVVIPLALHDGTVLEPRVAQGDRVRTGQIVGEPSDEDTAPMHASVTGIVEGLRDVELAGQTVAAVVIKREGEDDWMSLLEDGKEWQNMASGDVARLLVRGGIDDLVPGGLPPCSTSALQEGTEHHVEALIVCALHGEPFMHSNHAILRDRFDEFAIGLEIITKSFSQEAPVHIALSTEEDELVEHLDKPTVAGGPLHIHPLEPRYPQDMFWPLMETILGQRPPHGLANPADCGVLVADVEDVLCAYDIVVEGRAMVERTITLGGEGFTSPCHVRVRTGTPIRQIVEGRLRDDAPLRILAGGPMRGRIVENLDDPLRRTTPAIVAVPTGNERAFLSFMRPGFKMDSYSRAFVSSFIPGAEKRVDTNIRGERRACILCGYCQDACPVGVIPHILHKYSSADLTDEADHLHIFDCIECGLCSYVCPSKIPLLDGIRDGKRKIEEEREEA